MNAAANRSLCRHEHRRRHGPARPRAAAAAAVLALASTATKNRALAKIAASLRARAPELLAANALDMEAARAKGLSGAMLDRLALDEKRVEAMARGVEEIAALADPIGAMIAQWTRPNGLDIARVRVPLGVIGIIYESRPNVTCDAGALCLKSGNAAILRGGSESVHSSRAIHACLVEGLQRRRVCRPPASSSCRPPIAPPWATCCRR